jgi:hypothetical protein
VVDADGTQAPEPPKPFGDSLGGTPDGGGGANAGGASGGVARPVEVNREAAKQLAAALATEEGSQGAGQGKGEGASGAEDDEPTAEIPPRKPRLRASAPTLLAPIMRRRKPAPPQARRPVPQVRKPSSGSAGLVVALTLGLIFLIVAIQFVVSFVESVTGIFD